MVGGLDEHRTRYRDAKGSVHISQRWRSLTTVHRRQSQIWDGSTKPFACVHHAGQNAYARFICGPIRIRHGGEAVERVIVMAGRGRSRV